MSIYLVKSKASWIFSFFFCLSSEPESRLTVLSVKAMLSILCGGKLVDKLRCEYHTLFWILFKNFQKPIKVPGGKKSIWVALLLEIIKIMKETFTNKLDWQTDLT